MRYSEKLTALWIAVLYFFIIEIWDILSDTFIQRQADISSLGYSFLIWKDLAFALLTAVLLFIILNQIFMQRKQFEQTLQESEERYRSLYENSQDAILLTAPDGRILSANQAACNIFRQTEEDLCTKGRDGVIDLSDARLPAALEERARTGRFRGELFFLRKDGTHFPAEVSSAIFKDRGGNLRTSMIIRDITERKQAEETLRENEARLKMLVEKMPAILWTTDTNLRYTYHVGAGLAMVGLQPNQSIGKELGSLSTSEDTQDSFWLEQNRQALAGKSTSYDVEWSGRTYHCDVEPLKDPEGKIIGTIGVALDITTHKQAEIELTKLSQAIEQTADTVLITDKSGVIKYTNPAFESITGYSRSEVIGKTPRVLKSGVHDEAFYRQLWKTVGDGQVFRSVFTNRRKNGELYYEEKTITPIHNEQGQITSYVATGKDISERVAAYQTLERRVEERTREVNQLYAQADQRSRELAALYSADEQLHQHLRLEQVLQAFLNVTIDLLHADKTSVQLWDENQNRLVVKAWRGLLPESIELLASCRTGEGIAGKVFETGEPVALEHVSDAPPPMDHIAKREDIHSILSIPINISDRTVGVFMLYYCQPRTFYDNDKRFFQAFAQRAGLAIANARLYEQAEQTAILTERQRMARELHDSVTQSLYSLTLIAEAGRRMATAGDLTQTAHYLGRLGETARQALKEMRLMVYEMRPLELQHTGLVKALQQRLDAVEKRSGTETQLEMEGAIHLPIPLEEDLYRIAQEALNNAIKHSAATKITVRLHAENETLELEVEDNGTGLNIETVSNQGGMGLENMRERAHHLGGKLTLISKPGVGTNVKVIIPIPPEDANSSS